MLNECPECGGTLVKKTKEIEIRIPNPGLQLIKSGCLECQDCHEEVFNEKQSKDFAKKVDNIIATEAQ